MRKITFSTTLFWLPFVFLFLFSCDDKMEEHYKVPDWLRGSAWSVLNEKGNYSIFLKGVELAGYKPMMEGKSILTVMAPDDVAFAAYLKNHGYASINDLTKEELNKLIGFHLLYYSYNKERMVNFRPEGDLATDADKEIDAGLYFKFRTKSTNPVSIETDKITGRPVTVYHLERFLPVFSYRFFASKDIDAKSNYEYFYPKSTWTGSDGFNASNASINEYSLIADNGYIYTVNQVLEPLETIYKEMEKRNNYSQFLSLYDSYSTYEYDKTLSDDYGKTIGVDSLYLHKHGVSLPPIAMEWPVSSFQQIKDLSSKAYSVFAPSNTAFSSFYERFWKQGGYQSLTDVDPLIMNYLLLQCVYQGSIVFPEEIKKGKIKNGYGLTFNFDPDALTEKAICVNGSFYGIDNLVTPPLFASVIGPAFRNKPNAAYLYALHGSTLLNSFVSSNANFIMLMPTTNQFSQSGIELKPVGNKYSLQIDSENGWVEISSSRMQDIVNIHTVSSTSSLKTSGTQVFSTQLPFNYWYVKDGAITISGAFNKVIEPNYTGTPFVPFHEITDNGTPWSNGKAYSYDSENGLFQSESTEGLKHALAVCNDARYPYNSFVQLMKAANMVSDNTIPILLGTRFITFIPTNDVIQTGLTSNRIPGITGGTIAANGSLTATKIDAAVLRGYLYSYFLRSAENVITTYPYPGSTMKSGTYNTGNPKRIIYTDLGTALKVQQEGGNVANVIPTYNYFPFAYNDGCFHLIDAIF